MVIPWIGYPLSKLLAKVEPNSNAKFVQFLTFNPETLFPDDANRSLPWPYSEGLRIDEAMHPLALLTFGMYGEALPNQNGAPGAHGRAVENTDLNRPRRWSRFGWSRTCRRPRGTTRKRANTAFIRMSIPNARIRVGAKRPKKPSATVIFPDRRETEKFNGYGEEVAGLYAGMDLQQQF